MAAAEVEADPAAQKARACLAEVSRLEAMCRAIDIATALTGVWLLAACFLGYPVLGLIPFGVCLVATAVALRRKDSFKTQAMLATLQVQDDHPHLDSGCDC